MKVARSVAEVLAEHTALTLECIDRMYLNVYVPLLQSPAGAAYFFRKMRGAAVPSSALMALMTRRFVDAIKSFAARNGIEIVSFRRGERKDDRTREYLRNWAGGEGVLYIGKAQEKAKVVRTERRHDPATGDTYPWLVASTAMVNQFYFYAVDDDFGPFFLKFCSYFPYNAKLCINGHEYLKQQLTKQGIAYESLDNGILRCADPVAMQRLADGLTARKVDALLRKWLARLPHPFTAPDRQQGIRYDVSILQAEFALTQVFDRPAQGRVFFEEVVRENLDMGRPDHVQLIVVPLLFVGARLVSDVALLALLVEHDHQVAEEVRERYLAFDLSGRQLLVSDLAAEVFPAREVEPVGPFARLVHLAVDPDDDQLVALGVPVPGDLGLLSIVHGFLPAARWLAGAGHLERGAPQRLPAAARLVVDLGGRLVRSGGFVAARLVVGVLVGLVGVCGVLDGCRGRHRDRRCGRPHSRSGRLVAAAARRAAACSGFSSRGPSSSPLDLHCSVVSESAGRPARLHPGTAGRALRPACGSIDASRFRRFIPAWAGLASGRSDGRTRSMVHPRWRGAEVAGGEARPQRLGSIPVPGGTPRRDRFTHRPGQARFIPAGAGRTCSSRQRKRRGAEECTGQLVGSDDSPRDIASIALASEG